MMLQLGSETMGVIIVHGGVETSSAPAYIKILRQAALAGHSALGYGLLEAVVEAVKVLEDSPLFNAGYGSVPNFDGEVEMDAAVMDGHTGKFGAVAAITSVAHPVSVAHLVLEETPHVLLAGAGATHFARSRGFPPFDSLIPQMLEAWRRAKGNTPEASLFTGLPTENKPPACDTVGCVASLGGRMAAASSTGGSFLKLPGRVGDTPVPGGGIYASQRCSVVCTGLGEAFIETLTAKFIDSLLAHGMEPQEAAERAICRLAERGKSPGGVVVVDSLNRWGAAHNTGSFPVALVVEGKLIEDYIPKKIEP
ncbi:MAG: isoaspartyl peptidase/L-asparaginase family protein [Desulfocucumaceae bacterium]